MTTASAVKIENFSREWLDENDYQLTDVLFQQFNLLNERDWELSENVAIAKDGDTVVGVIIGYDDTAIICQVAWDRQRQGIGSALVKASGMFYPKQNGAPEFWEAMSTL